MISCYELRLGNHLVVNGSLQQVSSITRNTVFTVDSKQESAQTIESDLEKVEPVPLSTTVLSQCGFVYHEYFKFWQLITTDSRSEMDIDSDYHVLDFMRKPVLKRLTSLHQLQNIYFMLKGRELKYDHIDTHS